ncbi:hypothetical protein LJC58_09740 [Lachnospiraceae bacterium OttesenSCG-928-D06]|nr:hypothetical protein [Lachnospiraceae bacterium OttesenSCG-928-D06]
MWQYTSNIFAEYMGTGLIVGWFLLSVIYLCLTEKQKHVKIMFVYVPVILLLVFFNPIFAKIIVSFVDDEIYYRILWLLPYTVVVAYAFAKLIGDLKKRGKLLFLPLGCALVICSGSFIYSNPYFSLAENIYHMPNEVVEICDAIEVEKREVMAVFPKEMLQYVRQYSAVVCMPYGREIIVERWGNHNELYQLMESEVIDAEELARLAKENGCHYVILHEDKEIVGDLLSYDYILYDSIRGYDIYQDMTIYIGL